jgi:ATP-dependent DNA helicase RecG
MNLSDQIGDLPSVGPVIQKRLQKLGIETIADLLWHLPRRFVDYPPADPNKELRIGEKASVQGSVTSSINQTTRNGRKIQIIQISYLGKKITCVWFNQPYILKNFPKGSMFSFSGELNWFGKNIALFSPEYEQIIPNKRLVHTARLLPVYPQTAGISSKWLRAKMDQVINNDLQIEEAIDPHILADMNLASISEALQKIHFPIA